MDGYPPCADFCVGMLGKFCAGAVYFNVVEKRAVVDGEGDASTGEEAEGHDGGQDELAGVGGVCGGATAGDRGVDGSCDCGFVQTVVCRVIVGGSGGDRVGGCHYDGLGFGWVVGGGGGGRGVVGEFGGAAVE